MLAVKHVAPRKGKADMGFAQRPSHMGIFYELVGNPHSKGYGAAVSHIPTRTGDGEGPLPWDQGWKGKNTLPYFDPLEEVWVSKAQV